MQHGWRSKHFGLIFLAAVVLATASLVQDFRFDRALSAERASQLALDRTFGALELALSDVRGAQTGYLATGQTPDVWMQRAAEHFGKIEATLKDLRAASTNADALVRYEASGIELAKLVAVDRRAREQVQNDQRFVAADIVFVDGLEASERVRTELAATRLAETLASSQRITQLSQWRLGLNVATLGLILMAALFLGRSSRQPAASETTTMAQMLRELPPPVKPAAPAVRAPAPPAPVPVANLADTAELCVDLARVMDSRDVPALLERAASVLDAKGIILWTVDASGRLLRPSLTHGYPSKVLTRLGALNVDADNVTSLSFRSKRPQMMPGAAPGEAGAIAVPLMTASGCSGVLAAEIRESKPAPELVAITKILAAQFATLVGPGELAPAQSAQA